MSHVPAVRFCPVTFLLLFVLLFPGSARAADDAQMKETVRRVLRENPDLILDILKDHSEMVLEIAQQGQNLRSRRTMRSQWESDIRSPKSPSLEGRAIRGNPAAPVTIVAYSDYQCPYCRMAEENINALLGRHPDAVRLVFKALPNTKSDLAVAVAKYGTAAFNQDADKAWQFHDALFARAEDIEKNGDTAVKALAVKCGLDLKRLMADAASAKIRERMAADEAEAEGFGIRGTPYFLMNDILVRGAVPRDMLEEALQKALALKKEG
ncbi:MAG: thioredoxin domain-containing protein [Deltaproteobacteria bacterium]|jgi:protein-disulfide isomerase|nr:thioredoxin domain-containing protein [Deltaproteobacteria bacterium]